MWAARVLLLWWAHYYGQSGRLVWLLVQLVSRPCLMWRLLATVWWGWVTRQLAVETPGGSGLLLAHWWVELGSWRSSGLCPCTGGEEKSWGYLWPTGWRGGGRRRPGLAAGLRDPRTCVGPLLCGAGSWHTWLWCPGCPKAWVGPLMRGAGSWCGWLRDPRCLKADVALLVVGVGPAGLVLAWWWVNWVLQAAGRWLSWGSCPPIGGWGCPKAKASLLVGRDGTQEFWSWYLPTGTGSQGLCFQGTGGPRPSVCALVCGARSWSLWWVVPCPVAAVGSGVLKAACQLMGGTVSPPS